MKMLIRRTKEDIVAFIRTSSTKRSIAAVILLIVAIPLTVFIAGQEQENRSRAALGVGFKQVAVNGCGEWIEPKTQPGAQSGDVFFVAPVRNASNAEWETRQTDGGIVDQARMRQKFLDDERNGHDLATREQNWNQSIGDDYINCNVFIEITGNGDCDVEFVGRGSTDNPMAPGETSQLHFVVNNQTGGFCRKLFHVKTRVGVTPTGTQSSPTPSPTQGGTSPTPTTGAGTPTPTPSGSSTPLDLSLKFLGIGSGPGENPSPRTTTRTGFSVEVYNANNQLVATSANITITFHQSGVWFGRILLPPGTPSGKYSVKVKQKNFLKKDVPGTHTIEAGRNNQIGPILLSPGDTNNDNILNVLDYNIIVSCFDKKASSSACGNNITVSDLNDNGIVDGVDINIFLRSLAGT